MLDNDILIMQKFNVLSITIAVTYNYLLLQIKTKNWQLS